MKFILIKMNMSKINNMRRIKEEFEKFNKNPLSNMGITVGLFDENNIFEWRCALLGPKDSYYKGGLFYLKVKFPDNYPESPPEILFVVPIYHLNVNSSSKSGIPVGKVYLHSLYNWKNYYNMEKILPEIFVLLYKNDPDCGFDQEKNQEYLYNRKVFDEKVKYFTKKLANPLSKINNSGFDWDFSF